jgi:hypothetical protein
MIERFLFLVIFSAYGTLQEAHDDHVTCRWLVASQHPSHKPTLLLVQDQSPESFSAGPSSNGDYPEFTVVAVLKLVASRTWECWKKSRNWGYWIPCRRILITINPTIMRAPDRTQDRTQYLMNLPNKLWLHLKTSQKYYVFHLKHQIITLQKLLTNNMSKNTYMTCATGKVVSLCAHHTSHMILCTY